MSEEWDKDKWLWMMEYCKKKLIPPAQQWAWKEAENAYIASKEQK